MKLRMKTLKMMLLATAGGLASVASQMAHADDAAGADSNSIETVDVTATRVMRAGFTAPTPTTSVTAADLAVDASANIADTLNTLPALKGTLSPTTSTGNSNFAGGNYLDLRGLSPNRTLVLVDGARYVPSSIYNYVNVNLIPQVLVKRVDVVTGGASAQWGSDAVGGVVNFVLDHDLEGLKGNIEGMSTDHGDNQGFLLSVAAGHTFADGKAHLELAGEWSNNNGVTGGSNARDWFKQGWETITNPNANGTAAEPARLIVPNAKSAAATYGGLITSGPLKGIQFGPGGTPIPFNYGTNVTATTMEGGDGFYPQVLGQIEAPLQRQTLYGLFNYDLTPDVSAYIEASYGHSSSNYPLTTPFVTYDTIAIKRDNAFLPASIGAAMDQDGISSFTMGRYSTDYAMTQVNIDNETSQITGGLKGTLGGKWNWDAHYSYGGTNVVITVYNNRKVANYALAIDSVINPATGAAVCRSTLTNPTNGCVPIDPFGVGSVSPDAQSYVTGTSRREWQLRQASAGATLNGEPFSLWAGPVSVATGIEYRRQSANITADALSAASGYSIGAQVPWSGDVSVWEGFGEVVVPLVSKTSWANEIDVDLAMRETGYSTSGNTTTWKAGVTYEISDDIRLRAAQSRDLRAPTLADLFQGGSQVNSTVIDRQTGQSVNVLTPVHGNPNLRPETADTTTVGAVFTPRIIPNFTASIDYYDINVKGMIASLTAQAIVDQCYSYNASCDLIQRNSAGQITTVENVPVNLQTARDNGVDLEAEYRIPDGTLLDEGFGDLSLHFLGNYVGLIDYAQNGSAKVQLANSVYQPTTQGMGGEPRWRYNLRATWDNGPYTFSVSGRYVGGGNIDNAYTPADINILKVSSRFYTDLSFQYAWDNAALGSPVFYGTIKNVFDIDPPVSGGSAYALYPSTSPQLYDTIGRLYTVGLRFNY